MDSMSGKPLVYKRETPGAFTLYSVGWNLVDDGGVVEITNNKTNGAEEADYSIGDMVWKQPQTQ